MTIQQIADNVDTLPDVIQVFIMRHGQTDANKKHIVQGHLDTDLNEQGILQAQTAGKVLKNIQFDAIWSSDLNRCQQTRNNALQSWLRTLPQERILLSQLLRERSFSTLEGINIAECIRLLKKTGQTWETFGELPEIFRARLLKAWDEIIAHAKSNKLKRVIVVSHGGAISQLAHALLMNRGFELCDEVKTESLEGLINTSLTVINVKKANNYKGQIVEFNNADHLLDLVVNTHDELNESVEEEVVDNF
ncbi:histidine phosphatase superfamily [Lipomyces japonicus]|uniref:histidine phosphatase superfamily n=1 Tax=Lipomyces japonicus TaxID=56871 RepID=UPI0034CFEA35